MKKVFSFVFVMGLAFPLCESVEADIRDQEVRSSDGSGSTIGFVYQHKRSTHRISSRTRRSRDPVIPAGTGVIQVAPISQFSSGISTIPDTASKPRFGYGSDYHARVAEPAPEVPVRPAAPEKPARPEPVPTSKYPDSDIPSVPSYSEPAPQKKSQADPAAAPDSGHQSKPDPSQSPKLNFDEDEKTAKELRQELPFVFEQSEVDANTARGWESPRIEFNMYPPIHREYYRVMPYFYNPFCRPVVPCPYGRNYHFGGHFSGPLCR